MLVFYYSHDLSSKHIYILYWHFRQVVDEKTAQLKVSSYIKKTCKYSFDSLNHVTLSLFSVLNYSFFLTKIYGSINDSVVNIIINNIF